MFKNFVCILRSVSLFLGILFLTSCKKDHAVVETPPTNNNTRSFCVNAYDESGNNIQALSGNCLIINFYQNNTVVYSKKLTTINYVSGNLLTSFSIDNFKDGSYLYEIVDSLGQFGYMKDSIVVTSSQWKIRGSSCTWSWCPSAGLGCVIKKPSFSILNYAIQDTSTTSSGITSPGVNITINVGSINSTQSLVVYFYKNNQVSYLNSLNYAPLYPQSSAYEVSPGHTTVKTLFYDWVLKDGTGLQSGDSVYFAVYPAALRFYNNCDALAKHDTLGYPQFTAIGSQRMVIPYKLQ